MTSTAMVRPFLSLNNCMHLHDTDREGTPVRSLCKDMQLHGINADGPCPFPSCRVVQLHASHAPRSAFAQCTVGCSGVL